MANSWSSTSPDSQHLRERNVPIQTSLHRDARSTVLELNALEGRSKKKKKDRKTFGRTPSGTVFTVPYTHDMVTQLLSLSEPKNISDIVVLGILGLHILSFKLLPQHLRISGFAIIFLSWRAGYNVGIGYLLHAQSQQNKLVRWATMSRIFISPVMGEPPHPRLSWFIKRELETKIPKDYRFEDAPIEYNTWLVFRRIVDLILMCDFTSYSLFALACAHRPVSESALGTVVRWLAGISLVVFNLWVKLDAHRVVKDFAWYWGDFFFLIDQELTFDGVFEMAPHPMYSVGYAGYYGISLLAASYKVLFISIIAHAAQFAFLVWVENPHIERTYNSPPPRRRIADHTKVTDQRQGPRRSQSVDFWDSPDGRQLSSVHNMVGIHNIDLYRTTDSAVLLLQLFFFLLTILTPSTPVYQTLFVAHAVIWRLWYSLGLGYVLNRQSEKKKWTRHFLKYGESTGEAWRQWRGTYHLSMTLCWASFGGAAWKMYSLPPDWGYGLVLLKHIVGLSLVALQLWVSVSIYDSLGDFGWFFGDFFFEQAPKLTYDGIYRFLNNPERVLGLAGVWGVALITSSRAMFFLALLSHTLSLAFIQFVERPHMQKLYGRNLRQDAGLVRSLKRSLPPPLRQWQDGMDKVFGEGFDLIEEFLDASRPKLAAGMNKVLKNIGTFFARYPARITIPRVETDFRGFNLAQYSLQIEDLPAAPGTAPQKPGGKQLQGKQQPPLPTGGLRRPTIQYGTPIMVRWTAPAHHSKRDWVGMYMVGDNSSHDVTKISSSGRWIATNKGEHDSLTSEIGTISSDIQHRALKNENETQLVDGLVDGDMVFYGDKLWWVEGEFEFRYHHNGKHNVMAISPPFEIHVTRFPDEKLHMLSEAISSSDPTALQIEELNCSMIEEFLLPVVRNCFDRDPDIAPDAVEDKFGSLVDRDGKYAKRVVYAVRKMFDIEFAPEVVQADGTVGNLARRIWTAKKILAPYSESRWNGIATPNRLVSSITHPRLVPKRPSVRFSV